MKILIELPTWLGDTVMTTPAIENIIEYYGKVEITLIGSLISIESLKNHPNVINTFIAERQLFKLYKSIKKLEEFDVFFSFRGSFRAKLIKYLIKSPQKYQYDKKIYKQEHQVEKYNNFVNESLNIDSIAKKLVINNVNNVNTNNFNKNKLLGINPGASYGSAKQWYPEEFAKVAADFSEDYEILIFGSKSEKNITSDIEKYLKQKGINNYHNFVNKTSIEELISQIGNLDLFITGDSGPMHLAAALNIPTVSIFGPTNDYETSQWMNEKSVVVKKNLECQPCMKRSCPLRHHKCMKLIDASEVLEAAKKLN